MATIRKRNNRYQAQVRRKNSRPISRTFLYRKDAEAWSRIEEGRIESGSIFPDRFENIQLNQLFEEYLEREVPRLKSFRQESNRIKFLQRKVGTVYLKNLTNGWLASYRDRRMEEVSPQTVKHELNLIRRVLKIASREWDTFIPNGVPDIRMPRVLNSRKRRLQVGGESALRENLGEQMNDIVTIALETAMRRGEIFGMDHTKVCFQNRVISLTDTKNGESRRVPMTTRCFETLKQRRRKGSCFDLQPDSITQSFNRACRKAGLMNLRFHDLRHEAISRFFEWGLTIPEVASISGHKDFRMLARYTHLTPLTLEPTLQTSQ